MNQKTILAKNAILIAVSKMSGLLALFILLPVMTATMSTGDYGLVDLVISYSGLIAPIVLLSLHEGIFRFLIDARMNEERKRVIITTVLTIISPVILLVTILYIVAATIFNLNLAYFILFYVLMTIFNQLLSNITRGLGKTKEYTSGSLINSVGIVIFACIALILLKAGVGGVFIAYSLAALVSNVYYIIKSNIFSYFSFGASSADIRREILHYSLPIVPNAISWWVFSVSDRTIISIVLGITANGIYAVSNKFASILAAFQSVMWMAWQDSAAVVINEDVKIRDKFFSDIYKINLSVMGSIAMLLLTTTALAFPFLVDDAYRSAYLYIPVLILGGMFNILISFYSGIYAAKKLTRQVMNTSLIAAIINIVVNLSLIWLIGIWAAAVSTAVAYGVMALHRYYDMKKYVNINYDHNLFMKISTTFAILSVVYYIPYYVTNAYWINFIGFMTSIIMAYIFNKALISKIFVKAIILVQK